MKLRRILVVKLADFGDALLTTPAIRALRTKYPEAVIDVLTTPGAAPVYHHCRLVDSVLTFEKTPYDSPSAALARPLAPVRLARRLRQRKYDATVLMHHLTTSYGALKHAALVISTAAPVRCGMVPKDSRRGWFISHRTEDLGFDARNEVVSALAIVSELGAYTDDQKLAFEPGQAAHEEAQLLLAPIPEGTRVVAIHPGSGPFSPARRWTAEGFAHVADSLAAEGATPILVGTAIDPTADVQSASGQELLDLSGETSLATLAAVLARCALLVCNDSGVMHLATAMGTPVVAVFGPSNQVAWGPWHSDAEDPAATSPHHVVGLPLTCRPCFYTGFRLGSPAGCPTRDCLAWLPPERVADAARKALSSGG